jgi:chromosome condensin MukBEF MukE localization factor
MYFRYIIKLENTCIISFGTEVARRAKYFLLTLDMTGNLASLYIQFNIKLVNSCMYFFFYRLFEQEKNIRTSMVSKTIRIVNYSLASLVVSIRRLRREG